ncbi:GIP, partial [Symbiodinium sp. CCMP2456]
MSAIRRYKGPEARQILRSGDVEVIPAKAVCTVKPGSPFKRKVRVVSCGNFATTTEEAQLYAGGAGAETLRTLLVHNGRRGRRCHGLDVKSAFLLAPIPAYVKKKYAVRPPRLLVDLNICSSDEVWMIDRALYGFRESPRWWSVHRDSVLSTANWTTEHGNLRLRQLASDSNVWSIELDTGGCLGHLLVYVDDMLIMADDSVAQSVFEWIRSRWDCTELQTATKEKPLKFLGVDIYEETDEYGTIGFSLGQEGYIDEVIRNHGTQANPRATTPTPKEWVREAPPHEDYTPESLREGQRITGELLWIAQRTRLDVAYSVGMMASLVSKSPGYVVKLGIRVLEYVAMTKDHRLALVPGKADGIRIYTDASFAPHGEHSITGVILQYDECSVVWKSKKQSLVTLSTAESELVAGCEGLVLGQSLEALIQELEGEPQMKRLLVDNTAAVILAEGGGSQRTSAEEDEDIDGEVRANPEPMVATGEAARSVEGPSTSTPAAPTGGMGDSMMSLAAATDVGASGPDDRTTAQGAVVTEPRGERSGSAQGPGSVLSGVLRAVQTLPATVEGLVSRSGSGRGIPGTPGLRDSVEYASVTSSAEVRPRPPTTDAGPPEGPLFDSYALERLQRLQEGAPLLYPGDASMLPSPPRPPSTSSSDVQAEVRRQLAELMSIRDEESRSRISKYPDVQPPKNLHQEPGGSNQPRAHEKGVVGAGEVPPDVASQAAVEAPRTEADLDPMTVVLSGMAQLQSVVTELTSPKSQEKPEVIKPGVMALPELPGHGPESSLAFADWLHASKPALADISDSSEELWTLTIAEATEWYSSYLRLDPLGQADPPSTDANSQQIKSMLADPPVAAVPMSAAPVPPSAKVAAATRAVALLDSGDARQEWLKTAGGTLVVPPEVGKLSTGVPDEVKASLAEDLPGGSPSEGKAVLKEKGMPLLHVDILEKGGKGWDLTKPKGVWRALMWAALHGKIAVVLSTPPKYQEGPRRTLAQQGMFLWSLASIARGVGIPYVAEHPGLPEPIAASFEDWSGVTRVKLSQGALGDRFLGELEWKGEDRTPPKGREWTELDRRIAQARAQSTRVPLPASPRTTVQDEEAEALLRAFEAESEMSSDVEEETPEDPEDPEVQVQRVGDLSPAEVERWKAHLQNGHVPYRRDCKQCVEGAGVGVQHRRVRHPQSYALSADLFGPLPVGEHGRDETCVSGRCHLKYALIGAFRVPRSAVEGHIKDTGVEDLFGEDPTVDPLDEVGSEYAPSEPPLELPVDPEGEGVAPAIPDNKVALDPMQEDLLRELFEEPNAETCSRAPPAFSVEAVRGTSKEEQSILVEESTPRDPEALKALIEDLRQPVDQVVLRYVIPLKGKSGPEVAEGLQKMILSINTRYPVRILHTDLGTEFISSQLSKWLAGQGVVDPTTIDGAQLPTLQDQGEGADQEELDPPGVVLEEMLPLPGRSGSGSQ